VLLRPPAARQRLRRRERVERVLELPPGTKSEAQGGTREADFVLTGVPRRRRIQADARHLGGKRPRYEGGYYL
jgi:hypothetical protein